MADTFKILSQTPGTDLNPTGNGFQDVWKVTYQVTAGPAKGTIGTISVPDEDHTTDFLSDAIAAKVQILNDVASL
jgi:uncharacterized membrane protein